jgi:type IV secretion system protein VirB4
VDDSDCVDGIKLPPQEFEVIKSLAADSRMFLVKQAERSTLCMMDLNGFDDALAVFSGTLDGVMLLDDMRAELGSDDPNVWLKPYLQRLRDNKIKSHMQSKK